MYENHTVCYTCGNNTIIDGQAGAHQIWHAERGETCRYGTASIVVDTIHHPAETEQQWIENWVTVVDKEAWDETVTVGYKCSCGAEQK